MTDGMADSDSLRKLANRLVGLERAVETLQRSQRAPRLAHSSVEDGSVRYRDTDGNVRHIEGRQPDGSFTVTDWNAPPPPVPTLPIVTAVPGGFTVRYDGKFANDAARPYDWRRTDVHVDLNNGFTATFATIDGGIIVPEGATLHFTTNNYVPHYVKLVAVNSSGRWSAETAQIEVTPIEPASGELAEDSVGAIHLEAGAVEPDKKSTGSTNNLFADPGFNEVDWRALRSQISSGPEWSFAEGSAIGLSGRWYAVCAPAGGADLRLFPGTLPVIEGERYYLAYWAAVSAAAVGQSQMLVAFYDADGVLVPMPQGSGDVSIEPYDIALLSTAAVTLIEGNLTAPVGATQMRVSMLRVDDPGVGSAGDLYIDKIELRSVTTRTSETDRVETGPSGIIIVNSDGNALGSISSEGTVAATALSVSERFTYIDTELSDLIDPLPRGIVAWGSRSDDSPTTTTEVGWFEVSFIAQPGRMYVIHTSDIHINSLGGSVNGAVSVRYTSGGAAPTVSSPTIQVAEQSSDHQEVSIHHVADLNVSVETQIRLLLTIRDYGGDGNKITSSAYGDTMLWIEDVGARIAQAHILNDGGGSAGEPAQTYRTTWGSTWTRSYNVPDPIRSADGAIWQGFYPDGYNGDNVATIGFNDGNIRSVLAGSTINKTEVYLYADHWYYNSGGTVVLGSHNQSAPLSTYPPYAHTVNQASWHLNKPEGRWVTVTNTIGNWFRDNLAKGLLLDALFLGHNYQYYGRFRGQNAGGTRPHLRITYTK